MDQLRRQIEEMVAQEDLPDEEILGWGGEAVPILIEVFEQATGDLRDRMRRRALHALGVLGTDEAVDFLIRTAENPAVEGWLRRGAIRSLGYTGQPRAMDFLATALQDANFGVRSSAVMALGHADDARALARLEEAQSSDPDERIRRRSARALQGEPEVEDEHGEPAPGAKIRN
jgi:HEAT repeat protein